MHPADTTSRPVDPDATATTPVLPPLPRRVVLLPAALTWVSAAAVTTAYVALGRALDASLDLAGGLPVGPLLLAAVAGLVAGAATFVGAATGLRATGRRERVRRDAVLARLFLDGPRGAGRERTGHVVSTATDAVERASFYETTFRAPIVASMTVPVVALVGLGIGVDWTVAGWLALAIPVIPLLAGGFQMAFRGVSRRYRATARGFAARFLDALQGLPTATAFGRADAKGTELAADAEGLRRSVMRLLAGNQLVLLVIDSAFSLAMVTAAASLAASGLRDGRITPGGALSVVLVSTVLLEPLDRIGQFFYIGMGGAASVKEIGAFLRGPSDTTPRPAPAPAARAVTGSAIEVRGVRFAHDDDHPILTGADLEVAPGERVAVVGPSGAGKSTLLALLQGELLPASGTVAVGGYDVAETDLDLVRSRLSVVAQSTYLFTGSLADNLRLASPEADEPALWDALDRAGLGDEVRAFPLGLETPVGERGLSLSGGQAQRVAMARALLKDAPVLLLDEPTSQVDGMSEEALLTTLDALPATTTVLVVSHRPTTSGAMDRVVRLEGGRLAPIAKESVR